MQAAFPALALIAGICLGADPRVEPAITSLHPFVVQRGTTTSAVIRGTGLRGARAVVVAGAHIAITASSPQAEPPTENTGRSKGPIDLVQLQIEAGSDAKPGKYPFRLVTANGVTNSLSLYITEFSTSAEPAGLHESSQSAIAVPAIPSVLTGRLSRRGETDYYQFAAKAGETLTFSVISGLPQTAAGGSAATIANFDPSLTIYESGGSWLDPNRLKRIAYNDESTFVFGRTTDVHLVHRFDGEGTYWMRVEAFAGQGGPDYSYQLRIQRGAIPEDAPKVSEDRGFTRSLTANRLQELAARGGSDKPQPGIESYRALALPAKDAPVVKLPAALEGVLLQPGETHRARFQLDSPRDLALEVQTPGAAPPFFNPIVRVLNEAGVEVATNIFVGKGACSGAMTKSMQPKALLPLREPGIYTIEVRNAIADQGGENARYRILTRPQVPHLGQVRIEADHLNLMPDEAKSIRVVFDREEDFRGAVAVTAESLPPGVQALVGADFEPDKDPPSNVGRRELFTPRTERTVVVFTALPDAPATPLPHVARIVVRPMAGGKLGAPVATKLIPLMVLEKPVLEKP